MASKCSLQIVNILNKLSTTFLNITIQTLPVFFFQILLLSSTRSHKILLIHISGFTKLFPIPSLHLPLVCFLPYPGFIPSQSNPSYVSLYVRLIYSEYYPIPSLFLPIEGCVQQSSTLLLLPCIIISYIRSL